MKIAKPLGILILLLVWTQFAAMADTVNFKNGKKIEVDGTWKDGDKTICYGDGQILSFSTSEINMIDKTPHYPSNTRTRFGVFEAKKRYETAARIREMERENPSRPVTQQDIAAARKRRETNANLPDHYTPYRLELKYVALLSLPNQKRPAPDAIKTQVEGYESGIFQAAYEGDLEKVKQFVLSDQTCVRHINSYGETPLFLAAAMCHMEVARFLLDNGADINAGSEFGFTPIMGPAIIHKTRENLNGKDKEIIKFLLSRGADINIVQHKPDPCICTCIDCNPIRTSIQPVEGENIRHFESGITRIIDLKKFVIRKGTVLHMVGDESYLDFLIKNGANVNVRNREGNTPMHLFGPTKYGFWLKNGADPTIKNVWGQTPYEKDVAKLKRASVEKYLKKLGLEMPDIPAHYYEVKKAISMTGYYVPNKKGALLGSVKEIKRMVENNPDVVNDTDKAFITLLHTALWEKHHGALEILLKNGADPNAVDSFGKTSLHRVRDMESVRLLLEYGADPNIRNCDALPASEVMEEFFQKEKAWREKIPALEKKLAKRARARGPL